jgi:hypothetical protein
MVKRSRTGLTFAIVMGVTLFITLEVSTKPNENLITAVPDPNRGLITTLGNANGDLITNLRTLMKVGLPPADASAAVLVRRLPDHPRDVHLHGVHDGVRHHPHDCHGRGQQPG